MVQRAKVRQQPGKVDEWRMALGGEPATKLVNAYLEISLACAFPVRGQTEIVAAMMQTVDPQPLLLYRAGICAPDYALSCGHSARATRASMMRTISWANRRSNAPQGQTPTKR
jgi:hypothetical protein